MLVVTGVFENERFIPDRPVSIPQKTKVVVTIENADKKNESKNSYSIDDIFDKFQFSFEKFTFSRNEANNYEQDCIRQQCFNL